MDKNTKHLISDYFALRCSPFMNLRVWGFKYRRLIGSVSQLCLFEALNNSAYTGKYAKKEVCGNV